MVAAIFAVGATVWVNLDRIGAAETLVQEAREELATDAAILEATDNLETDLRSFAFTGKSEFLESYAAADRQLKAQVRRLKLLAADDPPALRAAAADIAAQATTWRVVVAQPAFADVRAGRPALTDERICDAIRATIRADVATLRRGESVVLSQRQNRQRQVFESSRIALILGSLLAVTFGLAIAGRSFWQLIAARKAAEDTARRLEDALQRAHGAERAKTIFLANMSHQMRTPLNGILGMADALAGTPLRVPQRELLGVIRMGATTLEALIADLLTLSRGAPADEARMADLFETVVHSGASTTRPHDTPDTPPAVAEALPAAEGSPADDTPADAPMRILIVDDNATNRKVLELILDQFGIECVSVEDGQQAVDAVRAQDFATILMDIQMPVMDGLTATREIRRLEHEAGRPATPVIIVSANGQPEHVQAGRAAGAQAHLTKPVGAEMLVNAINTVVVETPAAAQAA